MREVSVSTPFARWESASLHYANIHTTPVDIDWSEALGDDCEGWRVIQPNFAAYDRNLLLMYAHRHDIELTLIFPDMEETSDQEIADHLSEVWNESGSEDPMMNYYYPVQLGGSFGLCPGDAQFILSVNHLPLSVVSVRGQDGDYEHALALTGGGMDLSWEICEAYCRLGQVPPMHFWELPDMCGKGENQDDKWVLQCIREGAMHMAAKMNNTLKKIDDKIRWARIASRRKSAGKRPHPSSGGYIGFGDYNAAWSKKRELGDGAWVYELKHARKTNFLVYFVCPTQESVAKLKRRHKRVELMSGQCQCGDWPHSLQYPVRTDCPECAGKGPRPRCTECLVPCEYDATLCKYHGHLAEETANAK